jgi:hypothetical protein
MKKPFTITITFNNKKVAKGIRENLKKFKIKNKEDFYRNSILTSFTWAERAESKDWKKFVKAIQPLARKHLKCEITMSGAEEMEKFGKEYEGISVKEMKKRLSKK